MTTSSRSSKNDAQHGSSLTKIEKIIGIVVAISTGWSAYQANVVKEKIAMQNASLEALKMTVAQQAEAREDQKLNYDVTLKIFEEVKDIYKTKKQTPEQMLNRLSAVLALVQAVPEHDVQQALTDAIKSAADNITTSIHNPSASIRKKSQALKSQADLTAFNSVEHEFSSILTNDSCQQDSALAMDDYNVDFFWCESSDNPEAARQEAILASSIHSHKGLGRWRVRKLPTIINQRPGYQMADYGVRTSSPQEDSIARQMIALWKKISIPADNEEFIISRSKANTPHYISVHFCPDNKSFQPRHSRE